MRMLPTISAALLATVVVSSSALAATCNAPGGFNAFLTEFKKDAASKGVGARGLAALNGITIDDKVLAADKRQGVFKQTFEEFSARMISQDRMTKGLRFMQQHAATLKKIEAQFGVPAGLVVAILALETDFGVNMGKMSVVRSVATLAFDCRRTDRFQNELTEALKIIDRGDMTVAEMQGDWAGEIGQTQFLPSSYNEFAVDFDGDRKKDLIHSVPDVLGSTANYFKGHGWQAKQPWGEGTANFEVIRSWNKATVYAKTIAAFAERLEGANARAEMPKR
jgi:lytic murein transglycosylase